MHDKNMEAILNDPASTEEEKAAAQAALRGQADPVARLQAELLQTVGKPDLASVSYFDVQRFCSDHSFGAPKHIAAATRQLYDRWLSAFLSSEAGRPYIQEIAGHLRKHDFNEWKCAADEWKRSNWRDSGRLINVLERIADSTNRGNYHSEETVEECRLLAVEMRRRAGETQ